MPEPTGVGGGNPPSPPQGPPTQLIEGTDGPDVLVGTGGPNVIDGKAGDDTITGGPAFDVLTGGEGSDIFVYKRAGEAPPGEEPGNEGIETITDFNPLEDKIDLTAIRGFGEWNGTTPASDTVFAVDAIEVNTAWEGTLLLADTEADDPLTPGDDIAYSFAIYLPGVDPEALNATNVLLNPSNEGLLSFHSDAVLL